MTRHTVSWAMLLLAVFAIVALGIAAFQAAAGPALPFWRAPGLLIADGLGAFTEILDGDTPTPTATHTPAPTATATHTPTPTPTAVQASPLVRPYLSDITTTSATISWVTASTGASLVRYGADLAYGSTGAASSEVQDGRYWHSATLTGLVADSTYYYRVFTAGVDYTSWPEVSFTTAPASGAIQRFAARSNAIRRIAVRSGAIQRIEVRGTAAPDAGAIQRVASRSTAPAPYPTEPIFTPTPTEPVPTPPAPSPGAFTFAALGDSRPLAPDDPPRAGARAVAAQLAQRPLDLVVHLGDIVTSGGICSGADSSWKQYRRHYFDLYQDSLSRIPFYPAVGNHELKRGTCGYEAYTGVYHLPANAPAPYQEQYYSFDWGDAHFLILDTNQEYGPGSPQYDWLGADLEANNTRPWTFVFLHHPAYSSGTMHGSTPAVQEHLVPLFERYGVDLVFAGHDHIYERTCPILDGACATTPGEGVVHIVTGGAGSPLYTYRGAWFTAAAARVYHLVILSVDGCRVQLEAVDGEGTAFDRYDLDRCSVPAQ